MGESTIHDGQGGPTLVKNAAAGTSADDAIAASDLAAITADTGLRLDCYFGLSEGWWLRLQTDCEIRRAHRELRARINREINVGLVFIGSNPLPVHAHTRD